MIAHFFLTSTPARTACLALWQSMAMVDDDLAPAPSFVVEPSGDWRGLRAPHDPRAIPTLTRAAHDRLLAWSQATAARHYTLWVLTGSVKGYWLGNLIGEIDQTPETKAGRLAVFATLGEWLDHTLWHELSVAVDRRILSAFDPQLPLQIRQQTQGWQTRHAAGPWRAILEYWLPMGQDMRDALFDEVCAVDTLQAFIQHAGEMCERLGRRSRRWAAQQDQHRAQVALLVEAARRAAVQRQQDQRLTLRGRG